MFDERSLDIFLHTKRRKKRAILKHDANSVINFRTIKATPNFFVKDFDCPMARRKQAQNGVHQDGFSTTGPSDDTKNLATMDFLVQILVDNVIANEVCKIFHPKREVRIANHIASMLKRITTDERRRLMEKND